MSTATYLGPRAMMLLCLNLEAWLLESLADRIAEGRNQHPASSIIQSLSSVIIIVITTIVQERRMTFKVSRCEITEAMPGGTQGIFFAGLLGLQTKSLAQKWWDQMRHRRQSRRNTAPLVLVKALSLHRNTKKRSAEFMVHTFPKMERQFDMDDLTRFHLLHSPECFQAEFWLDNRNTV